MKKNIGFSFLSVACILLVQVPFVKAAHDISKYFPDIEGFEKAGKIKVWYPDNLYEVIDGAADIYLDYEFRELAVLTYEKPAEQSLTIEIYRHENSDYGFGIYTQERYGTIQNFVDIGVQGYYIAGILNFYKDCYYVKMRGHNLENEETLLMDLARGIAEKLPGNNTFPDVFNNFPVLNRQVNTESLVAKNFLGYPFFKMAFTAGYVAPSIGYANFAFFVIRGSSEKDCQESLQAYMKFLNRDQVVEEGRIIIEDPYYGIIDLVWNDNCIKGTFGLDDNGLRTEFLDFDPGKYRIAKIKDEVASGKSATSSSVEELFYDPQNAIDGDLLTRWSSEFSDPQWICIDLGRDYTISRIKLIWESAYGRSYQIEVSADSIDWTRVYATDEGNGREDEIVFDPVTARYVRLNGLQRGTPWGYSLYEFQVFKGKKR